MLLMPTVVFQVIKRTNLTITKSIATVKTPNKRVVMITATVDPFSSSELGQVHFLNSSLVSETYWET